MFGAKNSSVVMSSQSPLFTQSYFTVIPFGVKHSRGLKQAHLRAIMQLSTKPSTYSSPLLSPHYIFSISTTRRIISRRM